MIFFRQNQFNINNIKIYARNTHEERHIKRSIRYYYDNMYSADAGLIL